MSAATPTISIAGAWTYDSPQGTSEVALSEAAESVTGVETARVTLAPGETGRVVTPPAVATWILIQTPRRVNVYLNGGLTPLPVDRMMLIAGTAVTSVELDNDLLLPARQVEVELRFVTGGDLA
jgi:hypothetical protein